MNNTKRSTNAELKEARAFLEKYNHSMKNTSNENNEETIKIFQKPVAISTRKTAGGVTFNQQLNWQSPVYNYILPHFSLNGWDTWSMGSHTTEEIIDRLISQSIDNTCISYLCKYSQIETDFLDEFIILSTGYFHRPGSEWRLTKTQPVPYTAENIEYYRKLLAYELECEDIKCEHKGCSKEELKTYLPEAPEMPENLVESIKRNAQITSVKNSVYTHVNDRIDWLYIKQHQKFPQMTWARFANRMRTYTNLAKMEKIESQVN